ncbi:MAG: GIY-YIG nuclease family protein [Patescibacteria group bacterium]|nr:GIY-YIG nuclease family protein [Patescibacteria group bacterium]
MIKKKDLENLPSTFGVYIFRKKNKVLYIGKSVNIKARIKSHFESAKIDKKEFLIINQSDNIKIIITENEFQSLLLESELIKKYHPKYNIIWKDDKSYLYIKINFLDNYPKIFLTRKKDIEKEKNKNKFIYFGPFSSVKTIEKILNDIRHIVPFCTEKHISKKPCFYSKIGLCFPCPNYIEAQKDEELKRKLKKQYKKNIKKIIKIFKGKVIEILNDFYKQLKKLSQEEKFEEAIKIREKIFRLEKLINNPIKEFENYDFNKNNLFYLLKELSLYFRSLNQLKRIECYDISNLKSENQTASMVVMTDGVLNKKEYRKFKIKNKNLKSDFERIEEIIERRFKNKWSDPDLIIVDGGRPQLEALLKTLEKINKKIPTIGIAKNPDRVVIKDKNKRFITIKFPQTNQGFRLITLIRDEAHRFAKKYHIKLREKDFLI